MGYEIFRMLATKTQRKKRSGKKANATKSQACVDLEEEDRDKIILDSKSKKNLLNVLEIFRQASRNLNLEKERQNTWIGCRS